MNQYYEDSIHDYTCDDIISVVIEYIGDDGLPPGTIVVSSYVPFKHIIVITNERALVHFDGQFYIVTCDSAYNFVYLAGMAATSFTHADCVPDTEVAATLGLTIVHQSEARYVLRGRGRSPSRWLMCIAMYMIAAIVIMATSIRNYGHFMLVYVLLSCFTCIVVGCRVHLISPKYHTLDAVGMCGLATVVPCTAAFEILAYATLRTTLPAPLRTTILVIAGCMLGIIVIVGSIACASMITRSHMCKEVIEQSRDAKRALATLYCSNI